MCCLFGTIVILLLLNVISYLSFSADLSSQNTALKKTNSRLAETIKQFGKFNKTVTNGELEEEVNDLRSTITSSIEYQKESLASAEASIQSQLTSKFSEMDSIISVAKSQIDEYKHQTDSKFAMENNLMIYQLAGMFCLIGGLISMWHVTSHLRNFHNPAIQRKILAILWMAPIYSTTAWFSLVFTKVEGYLSIVKDCYEAYVVYVFFSFLIMVLGGGSRSMAVNKLALKADHLSPPFGCGCCFKTSKMGGSRELANAVLYQCQLYCMQFVLFKPILAIATFLLNKYQYFGGATKPMDYRAPQLYILIAQNLSVSLAFFGLVKFYHLIQEDLQWCRPWPKFLCIKGVVFMTFWQSMAISLLTGGENAAAGGGAGNEGWGKQAQSFLICIEMLIASIAHFYVFPTEEWKEGYKPKKQSDRRFGDNLALHDFVQDLRLIVGSRRSTVDEPIKQQQEETEKATAKTTTNPFESKSELSRIEEGEDPTMDAAEKLLARVEEGMLGSSDTSDSDAEGGGERRPLAKKKKVPKEYQTSRVLVTKKCRPKGSRLHR